MLKHGAGFIRSSKLILFPNHHWSMVLILFLVQYLIPFPKQILKHGAGFNGVH
jgi:hypothetical protein